MRTFTLTNAIMLLGVLAACSGETAKSDKGAPNAPGSQLSVSQRAHVVQVLGLYESLRSGLAADDVSAVAKLAVQLETATAQADSMPAHLSRNMNDLSAAAKHLKGVRNEDLPATRKAFGEVSRSVVALLVAEPSLRTGHFVFECPMAQGYRKWVQDRSQISNPYMGKAMPTCGKKSDWTVGGQ